MSVLSIPGGSGRMASVPPVFGFSGLTDGTYDPGPWDGHEKEYRVFGEENQDDGYYPPGACFP